MRILYIGDTVGRVGRSAVLDMIPKLRQRHRLDVVVVNCENAASGAGVTPEVATALLKGGADVLTSGNHIWKFREIVPYIEAEPRLIRPANYPKAPGRGSYVLRVHGGRTLAVIQVEGRVFMRNLECPFEAVEAELTRIGNPTAILVDVHCEATSEKQAVGWHFDGRVSAVVGTHTHVQTADERILPRGTAFITDVGMAGPHDSVIGVRHELAIERFLTQRFVRHETASGNVIVCGVVIDVDDATGKATHIERVRESVH